MSFFFLVYLFPNMVPFEFNVLGPVLLQLGYSHLVEVLVQTIDCCNYLIIIIIIKALPTNLFPQFVDFGLSRSLREPNLLRLHLASSTRRHSAAVGGVQGGTLRWLSTNQGDASEVAVSRPMNATHAGQCYSPCLRGGPP